MKEKLFKQLVASVREGGAILRGKIKPSRKFVADDGVKMRRRLGRKKKSVGGA